MYTIKWCEKVNQLKCQRLLYNGSWYTVFWRLSTYLRKDETVRFCSDCSCINLRESPRRLVQCIAVNIRFFYVSYLDKLLEIASFDSQTPEHVLGTQERSGCTGQQNLGGVGGECETNDVLRLLRWNDVTCLNCDLFSWFFFFVFQHPCIFFLHDFKRPFSYVRNFS